MKNDEKWLLIGIGVVAVLNLYITYQVASGLQTLEANATGLIGNIKSATNGVAAAGNAISGVIGDIQNSL